MKPSCLLPLILTGCLLTLPALGQADPVEPASPASPAEPAAPAVQLTPEQIENLKKQLAELETQIGQLRGETLSAVLTKLRTAVSSNNAALSFWIDCEKLVSINRKDLSREEAKRLEERLERSSGRGDGKNDADGNIALATRLNLQYLILTLEASETEDQTALIPKLQQHIQEVVASADKLKGRAMAQMGEGGGGRNPVIAAYQLQRYLKADNWTTGAGDLRGMWTQTLLPWYKKNKPEELVAQWDAFLAAEGTMRKATLSDTEFNLWLQNEYPALRFVRAEYLAQNGPNPVNALADLLKLIREMPGHADAPKWLKTLRQHIEPSTSFTPPSAAQ
jgi:hypothetical protein